MDYNGKLETDDVLVVEGDRPGGDGIPVRRGEEGDTYSRRSQSERV